MNCELLSFGNISESHSDARGVLLSCDTLCIVQQTAQLQDFSTGSVINPEQFH